MDWSRYYPAYFETITTSTAINTENGTAKSNHRKVEFADIGCGYGGLLDPHFKKTKHKWRIISSTLLAEYAYILRVGGLVYTITDVKELHEWMVQHFSDFPLFQQVPENELASDIVVSKLYDSTEEGQKVTRNNGQKWLAVFQRIEDPAQSS
ncbi:hypothetical protein C0Q70_05041 [Pomacea canaliculata]|uniref:tRNA (guanine(46)-N(7))-methyltransferase n=1 Tax=Pomacea canaliculata TaxID=400727 RepID=A0A2T7PK46_POMCA|nr:hypothetical protein C0Q70_05041 [Pomacea canaliculata]